MRTQDQLQAVGIYAQPTADAIHRGDPDIVVAQGNHFVSLKSTGRPDRAFDLEVLHLPWRSWLQYERRVVNTGRSYEANPDLHPSKNHHGMADYRRHLAGRLRYAFLVRVPLERDLTGGVLGEAFERDTWLRDHLHGLVDRALIPDLLVSSLDATHDDPIDPLEHEREATLGSLFVAVERERDEARKMADEAQKRADMPPPKLRLRDDWMRVVRRTAGAVRRRLRRR